MNLAVWKVPVSKLPGMCVSSLRWSVSRMNGVRLQCSINRLFGQQSCQLGDRYCTIGSDIRQPAGGV